MEIFKDMLNNIASMLLIIYFIRLAYQQRYQMTAGYLYTKEDRCFLMLTVFKTALEGKKWTFIRFL